MRRGDEEGSAIVEFTFLGVLLLVPLVYVLLTVFEAQSGAYGSSAASRAAARAYVLSPSEAGALNRAGSAARVALADQGIEPGQVDLDVTCAPDPGACLVPGATVTVRVTVVQPLPLVPSWLGEQVPRYTVSSTHTQAYGTFREDRS